MLLLKFSHSIIFSRRVAEREKEA